MRQVKNKLIAIVLAMTLVLSMSGVAFASVDDFAAIDAGKITVAEAKDYAKVKATKGLAKTKLMSDEIELLAVKTIETSATSLPPYDEWTMEPYTYGDAMVTATTTGWLWFDYEIEGADSDRVDIYLFDGVESDDGYQISPQEGAFGGEIHDTEGGVFLSKGTTMYLYFETSENNTGNLKVSVRAKMYSNLQRTLPAYTKTSQYMISSGVNKSLTGTSDIYYKVIPKKTGLMTVNLKSFDSGATTGKVTLYNANKKALSSPVQYNSSKTATKAYFGVTKGKTYYIRVQNCCGNTGKYGVRYGMTAATDRNISTNAKALKLKKGAAATKTLFTANNSTGTDVYKMYVSKTQKTSFTVNTQKIRSGNITIKVYKNGKQVGKTKTLYPNNTSGKYTITYGTVSGKASKGTYYIKVIKGTKVSGQYTIKYNK